MIPVTAEDVRREQLRRWTKIGGAALLVLLVVWFIYRRSVDPIDARAAFDTGTREFANSRYQEAILSFTRAISLNSSLGAAYQRRAQAYLAIDDPDRAIADYTSAIKLNSNDAVLLVGRAVAYLRVKDFPAAAKDASRATELDPKLSRAFNLRGVARRSSGDLNGGLADLERAVQIEPNIDNYYQRGATFQALGEHQKAIADFTEVIDREPDNAYPMFARAQSRLAIGDYKGARQDLDLGRKLDGR